jgi:hypothetical protein
MERQRNGVQDNSCGQRCSLCYQFFSWGKKKVNYKALKRPKLSLSFLANVSTHTSKFLIVHEKWELHNGRNDKSWPTAPRSAAATSSSPSRARPGNWIHCIVWGHGHNWHLGIFLVRNEGERLTCFSSSESLPSSSTSESALSSSAFSSSSSSWGQHM